MFGQVIVSEKGYMNLSKTSELIDDLGKLTDTEDLQKGLIDNSFSEVRNVKGLTKADIESWLINNPELAEEIYRKDKMTNTKELIKKYNNHILALAEEVYGE